MVVIGKAKELSKLHDILTSYGTEYPTTALDLSGSALTLCAETMCPPSILPSGKFTLRCFQLQGDISKVLENTPKPLTENDNVVNVNKTLITSEVSPANTHSINREM